MSEQRIFATVLMATCGLAAFTSTKALAAEPSITYINGTPKYLDDGIPVMVSWTNCTGANSVLVEFIYLDKDGKEHIFATRNSVGAIPATGEAAYYADAPSSLYTYRVRTYIYDAAGKEIIKVTSADFKKP